MPPSPSSSASPAPAPAILFTQCIQNDFVQLLDKYEPLPNLLHVGYEESKRLLGERVEEGPVHATIRWAYAEPPEKLTIIHIRDWHTPNDPAGAEHLRQFGEHCLVDSRGAEFAFAPAMQERPDHIVNASGLNDFVDTNLTEILEPFRALPKVRVGIMGVWTEAKVTFLTYDLRTRYPNMDIAICSALTASSSRAMHFVALDQLRNVLGAKVFPSVGDFTQFLTGTMPTVAASVHSRLDNKNMEIQSEGEISATDRNILLYLYRDCSRAQFKSLDGGFSGNVVLRTSAVDLMGHTQVPTVVKIGARELIAEERTAFERIQEVLGNNAPSIVDFVELEDRGGIKYRYASMDAGRVRVFQDLYAETEDTGRINRLLDTVFQKQLGRLYEAATLEKLNLLHYYDFQAKYAPGVRRRVEALLGKKAEGELLPFAKDVEIYNVCHFYEQALPELHEYNAAAHYTAFVHGDLNGRNIIVDAQENVWLIDFFHTHKGHVLKDLLKLENDIQYIMTPLENEADLAEACRLTEILIDIDDAGEPPDAGLVETFHSAAIRKAFLTVRHLRSLYANLIRTDRAPYQIHAGLMRYAMHTLSFDESDELQRRWALFAGSLCARRILEYIRSTKLLRVDYLSLEGPGRIGLTILPGRRDRQRNIEEDLNELKRQGVTHVLSLITKDEYEEYGVGELPAALEKKGFTARRFSILDQGVPAAEQMPELLEWIDKLVEGGGNLLIHCVGGLGRSGTIAAAYLRKKYSLSASDAIARVRSARGERAVENRIQEKFVETFATPNKKH